MRKIDAFYIREAQRYSREDPVRCMIHCDFDMTDEGTGYILFDGFTSRKQAQEFLDNIMSLPFGT
jgi:hypothetical protein